MFSFNCPFFHGSSILQSRLESQYVEEYVWSSYASLNIICIIAFQINLIVDSRIIPLLYFTNIIICFKEKTFCILRCMYEIIFCIMLHVFNKLVYIDISFVMCLLNDYVYFITDIDFAFASSY